MISTAQKPRTHLRKTLRTPKITHYLIIEMAYDDYDPDGNQDTPSTTSQIKMSSADSAEAARATVQAAIDRMPRRIQCLFEVWTETDDSTPRARRAMTVDPISELNSIAVHYDRELKEWFMDVPKPVVKSAYMRSKETGIGYGDEDRFSVNFQEAWEGDLWEHEIEAAEEGEEDEDA